MTTSAELREQFKKETGFPILPNTITREYVEWLEHKLISKEKPNPFTKPIIDYYFKWYEDKTGFEPDLTKGDTAAAKSIARYITRLVKKKCPNPTEKNIIDGFAFILNNYKRWDKFFQGQLKLSQINSNITNIIANIKGVTPNGKPNLEGTKIARELAARAILDASWGKNINL